MQYLGEEYRLHPVPEVMYLRRAKRYAAIKLRHDLLRTLQLVLAEEHPELSETIYAIGLHFMDVYGEGGAHFSIAIGAGISALRKIHPIVEIPSVDEQDWDRVAKRELALRDRPGIRTIENAGGIGLLEIRDVNPTYVDGYQEAFGSSGLTPYLGFTGLGAVFAHDLMHFASQRANGK